MPNARLSYFLLAALLACASPEPLTLEPEGGPGPSVETVDAGDAPDSTPDATVVDAGSVADAGSIPTPDAGTPQPTPDAGMPTADASVPVADPSQPGPYAVGVTTFELDDPTRNRSFKVDVWYPVDPNAPDGEANEYRLETEHGIQLASLPSPAHRDATPLALHPYPLVVFSHGYGGVRFQSFFLTEHLASHGIVVAAPDHPGNLLTDFASLGDEAAEAQSAMDRPVDLSRVLDRMLGDRFGLALEIDPNAVLSSGHSFGGWTCLELARRDPRIRGVIALAPGFRNGITPDFVADLHRPVAFFGASLDQTCPFDANQQLPYELAAPPKILLELMGAGHMDFSNMCDIAIAQLFVDDGCNPDNLDPAIAHARVNTVATAFIERELAGELGYEPYLDPTWVNALGNVQYWRAH